MTDPFFGMTAVYGPPGSNGGNPVIFAPPGPIAPASIEAARASLLAEGVAPAVVDAWAADVASRT